MEPDKPGIDSGRFDTGGVQTFEFELKNKKISKNP
jgi:hypothetical protein